MSDTKTFEGRPIVLGEVLFDQFPTGEAVLGGAPFNVAWHLQGFGATPRFISRVGKDHAGEKVRSAMRDWGMDDTTLQTDPQYPTGTVQVTLDQGQPTFHILSDQAYDHLDIMAAKSALETIRNGSLLYHGTLILRAMHGILEDLLAETVLPVFVDINLRDPWWNTADLPPILQRARWVKANDTELMTISHRLGQRTDTLMETARHLQKTHRIQLLIITQGDRGAIAFDESGQAFPITPQTTDTEAADHQIVDTVGAGDAFSAVVILGLLRGWSLPTIMRKAQAFASRVCRLRGAISLDPKFYRID
uniref:Fructokinase n=1 Tax=Candidatus Kentrum sp. TUN TaxID=2126343 RepID=A0A450ZJ39_9GAMM|nr:MAG: fructokinase [Candidatus Kentron sp. TUN]VFK53784.1 MAG: fructokinase [Candidatus Kentron sp. TUN]VFK56505.1 MAG: fructokinase [Candidatus Kentron sp. TUN]